MKSSRNWSRKLSLAAIMAMALTAGFGGYAGTAQAQDPFGLLTCPASLLKCNGNLDQCNGNQTKCTNSLSTCMSTLSTCQSSLASAQGGAGTPGETRMLFPFIINQNGFDTTLTIANTSMDPFSTVPETGACNLTFYGTNAPAGQPISTGSIAAGQTYASLASSIAPGFQGYMIADCKFDFAHGFGLVSDIGAKNLAAGYLALVIKQKTRTPGEALDE